jgi:hypothetical protein
MMNRNMKDRMGRAMPMRGDMADRMGRAMAAPMGMKKGGKADSKEMAKKEIAFMKKKGAPKSMIKHEKAEYGMKKGGMASSFRRAADGVATKGKTKGKMVKMRMGGEC